MEQTLVAPDTASNDIIPPGTPSPSAADDAIALVAFLRDRDIACPLCEYNLRGLTSPRCPECGRDLRLNVGLSEPRQGTWLVCQLSLCVTGGIGLLAVASVAKEGWPHYSRVQWLFNLCFAWYIASIPLSIVALVLRRRYLRSRGEIQRLLAVFAALAAAGSVAGLLYAGG